MIRTLLTTTAVTMLMTAGAMAQDAAPANSTMAPADNSMMAPADNTMMAPADNTMAPAANTTAPVVTDPTAGQDLNAQTVPGSNTDQGAMTQGNMNQDFEMGTGYVAADTDNLASRLIDQPVYSSANDDAEEIGNITDIVFTADGTMNAVVIGVGGFLGIGEKSVAVDFNELQFIVAADNTERWVLPTTADALTAAPDFVWADDVPGDNAAPAADGAMAPANGGAMAPANGTMAPAADGTMAPANAM